jgi:hypothetical protein
MSSESESCASPAKKVKKGISKKLGGAAKYKSKFQKAWAAKYPGIAPVKGDDCMFRCCVCNRTISCSHQGEADVTRHVLTDSHIKLLNAQKQQPSASSLMKFRSQGTSSLLKQQVGPHPLQVHRDSYHPLQVHRDS